MYFRQISCVIGVELNEFLVCVLYDIILIGAAAQSVSQVNPSIKQKTIRTETIHHSFPFFLLSPFQHHLSVISSKSQTQISLLSLAMTTLSTFDFFRYGDYQ